MKHVSIYNETFSYRIHLFVGCTTSEAEKEIQKYVHGYRIGSNLKGPAYHLTIENDASHETKSMIFMRDMPSSTAYFISALVHECDHATAALLDLIGHKPYSIMLDETRAYLISWMVGAFLIKLGNGKK